MKLDCQITRMALNVPRGRKTASNPFGSVFYQDLLKLYGMKPNDTSEEDGRLITFEDMATPILSYFVEEAGMRDIDLLVLAHWMPNCLSYNSTTSFLMHRFDLNAFAFAVSDQGTAAPFTALRIINSYLAAGAAKRACLIAIDQTSLPVASPILREREARDSAVGLILERGAADYAFALRDPKCDTFAEEPRLAPHFFVTAPFHALAESSAPFVRLREGDDVLLLERGGRVVPRRMEAEVA